MKAPIALVVLMVALVATATYPFFWLDRKEVCTTPPVAKERFLRPHMLLDDSQLPAEYLPTDLAPGEYAANHRK